MSRLLASIIESQGPGFIARGARVRVPKGIRPIEELQPGDEIICVDPKTGEHVVSRVTNTQKVKRECVTLSVGETELVCTGDHPIFSPEDGSWAPAGEWALGRRSTLAVSTGTGLVNVAVHMRRITPEVHDVFDVTVEHPHHNFIANGVLVQHSLSR